MPQLLHRPGRLHRPFRQGIVAVCGSLLVITARAGPRDQVPVQPIEKPGAVTVEPAVWTKRLVGRFSIDGAIHHEETVDFDRNQDYPDGEVMANQMRLNEWDLPVRGRGDCTDIGGGPGLQCVVNMVWPEVWSATGKAQLGGIPSLTPAMVLAGLTPPLMPAEISFLLVDDKGIVHPGSLTVNGDSAGAKPPCVNLSVLQCAQIFKISAKADTDTLFMELRVSMRFRRDKADRKPVLDNLPGFLPPLMERPSEFVDELLHVTLALKRLPRDDPKPASSQVLRP
jgi:hypothetical protein